MKIRETMKLWAEMGSGVTTPIRSEKPMAADASPSDVAHHHSWEEPSSTDQEQIEWEKNRAKESAIGRSLEEFEK